MKFLTSIVLSAALAAPVFANETYDTAIVTQPNQRWIFQRVSAISVEEGARITGRLTAIRHKGLSKGHVDVAVFSPDGSLLAEAATLYLPSILTRKVKRKGGVHFSVDIPQKLPAQSTINLSFHEDEASPSSVSLHAMNVAH